MNVLKKIICILLCFVLMFGVFSVSASAYVSVNQQNCETDIVNAIWNMKKTIDVSKYNFKYSLTSQGYVVCPEIDDIMTKIYYNYPEINYYVQTNNYYYNYSNGRITKLTFYYTMTKEQMLEKRELLSDIATYICGQIDDDWSDELKTLYIHDWLCANYCYDTRLYTAEGTENHGLVDMLEDGTGVCQSYAYAMIFLLRQCGIESYMAISDEDNHGWNVVKINGSWYHVDATHDDPIFNRYYEYDSFGRVLHNKFLLSDSEINDGHHDNWYIPFDTTETIRCYKYYGADSFKEAVSSVVPLSDGYWYYLDYEESGGGLKRTKDFNTVEHIYTIDRIWSIRDDGYGYLSYYTGLFEHNGNLFFTDETRLFTYDPEENNVVGVFELNESGKESYGRFFGFQMIDETCYLIGATDATFTDCQVLYLDVCDVGHPIEKWLTLEEATMFKTGKKVLYCDVCFDILDETVIPSLPIPEGAGDADGNGTVNTSDLAVEKLFLAGSNNNVKSGADFDKDGIINTSDLALLKLYLAYM